MCCIVDGRKRGTCREVKILITDLKCMHNNLSVPAEIRYSIINYNLWIILHLWSLDMSDFRGTYKSIANVLKVNGHY